MTDTSPAQPLEEFGAWHSGAAVLRLIREGGANDWQSLCQACHATGTHASILYNTLKGLHEVGLVEVEIPQRLEGKPFNATLDIGAGWIRVSPLWRQLQGALGASLNDMAALASPSAFVARSGLGRPRPLRAPLDVLVLAPFAPALSTVYREHILRSGRELGLTIARADDFFQAGTVIKGIWDAVNSARLLIADCTDRNPNVFYEVGLAHVVGKPVVFVTQREADVPFDVQHYRYILYENTPEGLMEFDETLRRTLIDELQLTGHLTRPPRPITRPEVCGKCGQAIYTHTSRDGSVVFFASLQEPWGKHPCLSPIQLTAEQHSVQPYERLEAPGRTRSLDAVETVSLATIAGLVLTVMELGTMAPAPQLRNVDLVKVLTQARDGSGADTRCITEIYIDHHLRPRVGTIVELQSELVATSTGQIVHATQFKVLPQPDAGRIMSSSR